MTVAVFQRIQRRAATNDDVSRAVDGVNRLYGHGVGEYGDKFGDAQSLSLVHASWPSPPGRNVSTEKEMKEGS